ncbi:MAG: histidine kinase [Deltaproteobacteria bacterium]|nr:histidine kinase [Deltaproteobacteria bacterium]
MIMVDNDLSSLSLEELEAKLKDLKGRIPAHSIRPAMISELEELEDEIEKRKKSQKNGIS